MGKKYTKATPANISRSRSKYTRRDRKTFIFSPWFEHLIRSPEFKPILDEIGLRAYSMTDMDNLYSTIPENLATIRKVITVDIETSNGI
jgi:IS1 family transposase